MNGHDLLSLAGLLIAALISAAMVFYVQRSTKEIRSQDKSDDRDTERQRLESEAYARARGSYEAAIANYEREAGRAQAMHDSEIAALKRRIDLCEEVAAEAETRADAAEKLAEKLEIRVEVLESELIKHSLPIPMNNWGKSAG